MEMEGFSYFGQLPSLTLSANDQSYNNLSQRLHSKFAIGIIKLEPEELQECRQAR